MRASLRIAVGIDGTPESLAAARWAAVVAVRSRSELLLVHGYLLPSTAPPIAGMELATLGSRAHSLVAEVAVALEREFPTLQTTSHVEPALVIPLLEEMSRDVDVLVLGHHRARWVERLISGSVSSAVSARAHSPVVTVPYGNLAEHGPVVIALDVEAPPRQAMTLAFDRAQLTDRTIVVVHAISDTLSTVDLEDLYARTTLTVEPLRQVYPECDVRVQLVNGSPKSALVDAVPQASLLVLTRPRAGTTPRAWIRSVSRAVQQRSTCPIAMVDHDRR